MLKILKMPSLSRVAAGSKATLELPVGPTYHRLFFIATGTGLDVTDIGRIDVLINGRVVQTFKNLQRLFDLNSFYSRGADTVGNFAIHFFNAQLADLVYRRAPGIGTADVQTFHVELDIAGAGPVDLAITAYAEIDPVSMPLGAFVNIREYPGNSSTSGEVEMDKLPRGPWYQALHLFKSDISAVQLEADGGSGPVRVIDATKAILERVQKEASPVKRVPVTASATHVDFCVDGDLQNAIQTAGLKDLRLKMTLGTSGAYDIVAESLDVLI